MINLTKETLDRLYKKQKTMFSMGWIITIAVIFLSEIGRIALRDVFDKSTLNTIILIIDILPFIYIGYTMKKLIPAGNGKLVKKAFRVLQQDFTSESTVSMLYSSIGQAVKYPEKVRLTLLLANTQAIRGNINEALQLLYSVDRSGFDRFPDVGMTFYGEIIETYSNVGDYDSVLRAFADGERFIEMAAERNYNCCVTAFGVMINVEKARGNYRKALDLRLIKNEYENLFNSSEGASQQGTPLNRFLKGAVFMETAELFYLCGDIDNAAKYLDIGGPMLSASPAETERANKLSAKIREAMAQRA